MKIKKEMILRRVGSDIIMIPVGSALLEHNGMFMLSESAGFLWENITSCETVEELAKKLFDEYDVSEAQALEDTKAFFNKLIEMDIIDEV